MQNLDSFIIRRSKNALESSVQVLLAFIIDEERNIENLIEYESDVSKLCCFRLSASIPFVFVVNPITRLAFYALGINGNTTTLNITILRDEN